MSNSINNTGKGESLSCPSTGNPISNHDLGKLKKTSSQENATLKTYPSRFWVLISFSLLSTLQCMIWGTWGPISASVTHVFDDWSSSTVALMGNYGPIAFVLTMVPVCYATETWGLRFTVLIGSGMILVGTILRCLTLAFLPSLFTASCHICAILNGIVGPLVMAAPPHIANDWFSSKSRTTVTAILQTANGLGSVSSYFEPFLVRQPSEDVTKDEIINDIKVLMYIFAGLSLLLFICYVIYFPSKPPSPPSITCNVQRPSFQESLLFILKNRTVLFVLISYGVCNGVVCAWSSVLNYSFVDLGMDQDQSKWLGLLSLTVTSVCSVLAGGLTDLVYGHLKLSLIIMLVTIIGFNYWFYLLSYKYIATVVWQIYVSVTCIMAISLSTSSLYMEWAVESSYPCSSFIIGGVGTAINNFVGLIFLCMFLIPDIGYAWVTYCLLGGSSLALIVLLFAEENYFRSDIDNKENKVK